MRPDIVTYLIESNKNNICCGISCRARGRMSPCEFKEAISSLDPRNFYNGSAGNENPSTKNLKEAWVKKMNSKPNAFLNYVRIVASNQGFHVDIKKQIKEYNQRQPSFPILLLEGKESLIGTTLFSNQFLMKENEKAERSTTVYLSDEELNLEPIFELIAQANAEEEEASLNHRLQAIEDACNFDVAELSTTES